MRKDRSKEIAELQEKVFGKGTPVRTYNVSDDEMLEQARQLKADGLRSTAAQAAGDLDALAKTNEEMNERLNKQLAELNKMTGLGEASADEVDLSRLSREIKQDFGVEVDLSQPAAAKIMVSLGSFNGVAEALDQQVIGQSGLTGGLVTAFKRPYVLKNKGDKVMNTILLMGPGGTGKTFALTALAGILAEKGILEAADIATVDLSRYGSADDEKLFLQDVYAAIAQKGQIIEFINAESCFPAYLSLVQEFFETGRMDLKKRYYLNNGQLVETNNALLTSAVDSLAANGHFLVFETRLSKEKIVDLMGAGFINSFADIAVSAPFGEADRQRLADQFLAGLAKRAKDDLGIGLKLGPGLREYLLGRYNPRTGAQGLAGGAGDLFSALVQLQLTKGPLPEAVELAAEPEPAIQAGQDRYPVAGLIAKEDPLNLKAIEEELQEIVGLEPVKRYVLSLKDNYDIQRLREKQGLKATEVSKHMIFTGNPGTGKTTIARIISKYLRALGVLSGGQLVEVTRADLVGKYVGHTAPLTLKVLKSALGGVLFIDEAYSLYRGKDDIYGLECIDTLVKGIEDYRDDLIVILAGYEREMEVFLTANTGLKSRFPNIINFPDYTPAELLKISYSIAKSKDYVILPECDAELLEFYTKLQSDKSQVSGNGRTARNKVEEAILNQSQRLKQDPSASLRELKKEDFRLDAASFVE